MEIKTDDDADSAKRDCHHNDERIAHIIELDCEDKKYCDQRETEGDGQVDKRFLILFLFTAITDINLAGKIAEPVGRIAAHLFVQGQAGQAFVIDIGDDIDNTDTVLMTDSRETVTLFEARNLVQRDQALTLIWYQ